MKLINFNKPDLKHYFKLNSIWYVSFFITVIVGLLVGIIISLSSDSYLKILSSENKVLYNVINGTLTFGEQFWKRLMSGILPLVIIFLLSLNYYSGLLSFVYICYQSSLLSMCSSALISVYGLSGVLNVVLLVLPLNLLYLCVIIFYTTTCLSRSYFAKRYKQFSYNFNDHCFWIKILAGFFCILVLSLITAGVIPMIIKSTIYVIF